jgi:hypothetical protein
VEDPLEADAVSVKHEANALRKGEAIRICARPKGGKE